MAIFNIMMFVIITWWDKSYNTWSLNPVFDMKIILNFDVISPSLCVSGNHSIKLEEASAAAAAAAAAVAPPPPSQVSFSYVPNSVAGAVYPQNIQTLRAIPPQGKLKW